MSLHTGGDCTFEAPANTETGTSNQDSYDCNLDSDGPGCSVIGPSGSYGTPFNSAGGGVYAMEWTSSLIQIWFFPSSKVPADITSGNPNPAGWGLPTANFNSAYGDCDIDANFPAQTIVSYGSHCGYSILEAVLGLLTNGRLIVLRHDVLRRRGWR